MASYSTNNLSRSHVHRNNKTTLSYRPYIMLYGVVVYGENPYHENIRLIYDYFEGTFIQREPSPNYSFKI